MGSAKTIYYFSRLRIQPFVSGGITVFDSTIAQPRVVIHGGDAFLNQMSAHVKHLAVSTGVGLRVPLARSVSLRPEIVHVASSNRSLTRASLGIGYAW